MAKNARFRPLKQQQQRETGSATWRIASEWMKIMASNVNCWA